MGRFTTRFVGGALVLVGFAGGPALPSTDAAIAPGRDAVQKIVTCPRYRIANIPVSGARPPLNALVPAGVVKVLLCRYGTPVPRPPLDQGPPEVGLTARRLIQSRSQTQRLAHALNSQTEASASTLSLGAMSIVAYFHYRAARPDQVVTISLGRPSNAINGAVYRGADASLVRELERLVGPA